MFRMTIEDVVFFPLFLLLIILIATLLKPAMTNPISRRYYYPALGVKLLGAIALGLIYQFYYGGGDTFNFFHDSYYIWQAFLDNPAKGLSIIFKGAGPEDADTYRYLQNTYFVIDSHTFFVIRLGALFGIFTLHHYSAIALCFAFVSFTGIWAMYRTFFVMYPMLHRPLAVACFFLPSVFFWGSGYMKDTITLGALGWAFYSFYWGVVRQKKMVRHLIIFVIAVWFIYRIKIYILLCFLPSLILWVFLRFRNRMRPGVLRALVVPLLLLLATPIAYVVVSEITEGTRYSIESLASTTQTTAEWLYYVSTVESGSAYSLGEFDGTWQSVISKFPAAVWVALFRPYLWEVRNPVMLLASLEATAFLFLTFRLLWQMRNKLITLTRYLFEEPLIMMCLVFAISFSFGVGVNSYNFGTLVRYKIPMMPFYVSGLYILRYHANKRTTLI